MDSESRVQKNNEDIKQDKSKGDFNNIKSNYILKKIFDNLQAYRALRIIQFNKKTQNRLNININDYIKCCNIEIEIIPLKNKNVKFINNSGQYYHIYLDDNKEETDNNCLNKNHNVSKITVTIDNQVQSLEYLFRDCDNVESITFKKFYKINITNMIGMFYRCSALKSLDISNFKTNDVTDMSYMFYGCSSLKEKSFLNLILIMLLICLPCSVNVHY